MRILSILQFSPPSKLCGGAERQMHSVHKGLISKGIDVQVLADFSNVGVAYQVFEGVMQNSRLTGRYIKTRVFAGVLCNDEYDLIMVLLAPYKE